MLLKPSLSSMLAFSALARVPELVSRHFEEPKISAVAMPRSVKCGQAPLYENRRIVNGSWIPTKGAFPFIVNIKVGWQRWCGGAVYDKYTVISAAHCFCDSQNLNDLKLFFADFDQRKEYNQENGQDPRKVKSIKRHPDYDKYLQNNDIAILKLTEELPFNDKIQPICMPTVEVAGGEHAITMGWGYAFNTNDDNKLSFAHLRVIPRESCRRQEWYPMSMNHHIICTALQGGVIDVCQGDSCGPLAQQNSAGDFELIGIVSWESGYATNKNPRVYTDIYDYVDWIKEVTGEPKY
ncbi:trypsin-2-like [Convolutriloba macropyga]|uniref:trypsin-2-like n=1 Tax=Convolutriloba macropyga TaxID=536237 RepID=UPI003F528541